jgi:hypothetical protein
MEEVMTESPVQSPTVTKNKPRPSNALSFYDALKEVTDGKKVTKDEWGDPAVFVELRNEKLMIKLEDGTFHPLIVSYGDLTGDDWIVV